MTLTAENLIADINTGIIAGIETNATGFFAPIMRASGHLLYALAASSSTPPTMTPEEERDELTAAAAHLHSTFTVPDTNISTGIRDFQATLVSHVNLSVDHWSEWSPEDHPRVLLALINEFMSFACRLDRELAGVPYRDSNPGTAL